MANNADVLIVAQAAVNARKQGMSEATIHGHTFLLDVGGMCARFVRQCHEAALGLHEFDWQFAAPSAWDMEGKLKRAGLKVEKPQPGMIVCLNANYTGPPGHIGIWAGDGWVLENTSCGTRGTPRPPGAKLTRLAEIGATRVSGYYAPLGITPAVKFRVTLDGKPLDCGAYLGTDGHGYAQVAALAQALGAVVKWNEAAQTIELTT